MVWLDFFLWFSFEEYCVFILRKIYVVVDIFGVCVIVFRFFLILVGILNSDRF